MPQPPSQSSIPFPTNPNGQGWENEAGDAYFQNQRKRADNADARAKVGFFKLMRTIGLELHDATSALTIRGNGNSRPAILDLCMAPGGFSSVALYLNPSAHVRGVSLPPSQGGHEMLLNGNWSTTDPDASVYISFRDITLLADEMGTPASSIPASHPDAASFSSDRPFLEQKFDLVFCDGQVLRTHERLECKSCPSILLSRRPPDTTTPVYFLMQGRLTYPCRRPRPRKKRSLPPPKHPARARPPTHPLGRHNRHAAAQSRRLAVCAADAHLRHVF
jgi:hypothetical protein